ncbi:DUF2846 domain-containing protein [Hydrogenophaga sp.]|uniref:DUF2846 domain-containing protein n=1 Tax=Hydrogenophaga sp. TaxID=1904254 RepID=UPI002603DA7A|nr:DUF2846 domain-containing protein [Hydrogenophaga sp.]MCW5654007.1 DUF2846 domain-containing protein [Hydrogenophaga sp.]
MTRLWRWLPWVALVMLSGCAATGPRFAEVQGGFPDLRPGYGRLLVYRTGIVGAAVQPDVRLNGEVVGKSLPDGFFFVDRAAGRYRVSMRTEVETALDVELSDGATVYVQSGITLGLFVGQPRLTLETAGSALPQLGGLAYTGSVPLVPGRSVPRANDATPTGPSPAPRATPTGVTLDDLGGLMRPAR